MVVDLHGVAIVACLEGKLSGLAIDGVHVRLAEPEVGRLDHVQRLGAKGGVAVGSDELQPGVTKCGGGEGVAGEGSHPIVLQSERCALGDVHGVARGRHSGHGEAHVGADREVVIVGGNEGVVELVGGTGRGDHDKRGGDGALVAIGRAVHDRDLVRALGPAGKGRRATAVQVDGSDASGLDHDLGYLLRGATGGVGLLTAVEDHEDDLAIVGDAHAGPRVPVAGVVVVRGDGGLAVLDKVDAGADGLPDPALVGRPVRGGADDGGAVVEDGEEVLVPSAVILLAVHHESAGRNTVCHVVEVGVDAGNGPVVGDVVLGVVGVVVTPLGSLHLLGHALHAPARGVVVLVVGLNGHVVTRDVYRRQLIDDLLVVDCHRLIPHMSHAGGQRGGLGGEDRVVRGCRLVKGVQVNPICEGVAGGLADVVVDALGEIRPLKGENALIAHVEAIDVAADVLPRRRFGQAHAEEVPRPDRVREVGGEVVLNRRGDGRAGLNRPQDIERIKVAVQVGAAKGVGAGVERVEEIPGAIRADDVGHLVDRALLDAGRGYEPDEVGEVASPASEVGSPLVLGVPGHVEATEHVAEVHLVAVGEGKGLEVSQGGGASSVGRVLLSHVSSERRVLGTAEGGPVGSGVARDAGTDEVDNEGVGILPLVLLRICAGIALEGNQRVYELVVGIDGTDRLWRGLDVGRIGIRLIGLNGVVPFVERDGKGCRNAVIRGLALLGVRRSRVLSQAMGLLRSGVCASVKACRGERVGRHNAKHKRCRHEDGKRLLRGLTHELLISFAIKAKSGAPRSLGRPQGARGKIARRSCTKA